MELEPTRIGGKYEILRELGSGGFATVYLAREVATELGAERLVAIKVLRDDGTVSDARQRFSQEIRVMANLRHPHIVPLFDTGVWDGRPYLVMPYIEGESLASRLKREGKLPVDAVIRMGIQMCEALDYAHRQHLVHRDVKPSNILFDATGNAWLADFGVARWTELTGEDRPTRSSAGAPGTLAYASPEQIAGDRHVDARADVYSLGVVLFETATGRLPFSRLSPHEFLLTKLEGAVPELRSSERDAEHILSIAARAMAPDPALRWSQCVELRNALSAALPTFRVGSGTTWSRRTRLAVALASAAAVVALALSVVRPSALDANRIALLLGDDKPETRFAAAALERQLNRYSDVVVVRVGDTRGRDVAPGEEVGAALRAGAGRLIEVSAPLVGAGAEILVRSTAEGDANRQLLRLPRRADFPVQGVDSSTFWSAIGDSVLFGAVEASSSSATVGTPLAVARAQFLRGYDGIRSWSLAAAESGFAAALAADPQYTEAAVWLAQTRFWADSAIAAWQPDLARSAGFRRSVTARTLRLQRALQAIPMGDWSRACGAYLAMTEADSADFAAWMGLAECWRRNDTVVRDARSPSGFRFATSVRAALQAYQRAFGLMPQTGIRFRQEQFATLRRLMYTNSRQLRVGREYESKVVYAALPSWDLVGDTLEFIPYPLSELASHTPPAIAVAVARNRSLFAGMVHRWVAADSSNPAALEALAIAQEQQADSTAIATLQRAITYSRNATELMKLRIHHFHALVRFGVGGRVANLERARVLGDSLLRDRSALGAAGLASVAILLGRDPMPQLRASAQARRAHLPSGSVTIPPALGLQIDHLTVMAALGAPFDTVARMADAVRAELPNGVGEVQARALVPVLLGRASQLLYTATGRQVVTVTRGEPNDVARAQAALVRGDTQVVRRILADLVRTRATIPRGDVSMDAVISESDLLVRLGDLQGATSWLSDALASLRHAQPDVLYDPVAAASLVSAARAIARVAAQQGDEVTAAAWREYLRVLRRE